MITTFTSQSCEKIIKTTNNWILFFSITFDRYDVILNCLKHVDEYAEIVEKIVEKI